MGWGKRPLHRSTARGAASGRDSSIATGITLVQGFAGTTSLTVSGGAALCGPAAPA